MRFGGGRAGNQSSTVASSVDDVGGCRMGIGRGFRQFHDTNQAIRRPDGRAEESQIR